MKKNDAMDGENKNKSLRFWVVWSNTLIEILD